MQSFFLLHFYVECPPPLWQLYRLCLQKVPIHSWVNCCPQRVPIHSWVNCCPQRVPIHGWMNCILKLVKGYQFTAEWTVSSNWVKGYPFTAEWIVILKGYPFTAEWTVSSKGTHSKLSELRWRPKRGAPSEPSKLVLLHAWKLMFYNWKVYIMNITNANWNHIHVLLKAPPQKQW